MKQSLATIIVLTLLGALAAARIVDTYDEFNATFDEGYQVAAGLQAYQQGRFDAGRLWCDGRLLCCRTLPESNTARPGHGPRNPAIIFR